MLRTFGLAAIAISASAAFAAVIARPLYAVVINPPIVVGAQAAPGVTTQGETYQNVTFSISNADPVDEGGTLVFQINRQGYDGQAHEVRFDYLDGTALLTGPKESMRFEPSDPSQKSLELQTVRGPPSDGEHVVRIRLQTNDDGAFIGEPSEGIGTIRDVPPATYTIVPDGAFSRGNDLLFKVTRTSRFDPVQLSFRIIQDEATAVPEASDRVDFAEGAPEAPLIVPAGRYGKCGGDVTVTLEDGAATSASVSFSDLPPPECTQPPWPPPPPWWLEYLPLLIGGFAFVTAVLLDMIIKPFVKVHPSCTVTPGAPAFQPLDQPVSRWPEIKADVTIIPGECSVPQPLPRLEQADG
jgi:hypothetical protein